MKKAHVITFGCQMNVADSETISGILRERGLEMTDSPGEADLVVVNTCSIRQKADEKAFSQMGRLMKIKERGDGEMVVVMAGCVAKKVGATLFRRFPGLDAIIGPARASGIGELLDRRLSGGKPVMDIGDRPAPRTSAPPIRESGVKAFVNIIHGCDNHCAYCVVPRVRGPEVSRPPEEILEEVRRLSKEGYGEVTLLGQNVNSYGKKLPGSIDFPRLLELLDRRGGIPRIRFTTSHPKDFGSGLIGAIRDLPTVCEAVHLPVQSGSDRVLRSMNRGYTATQYREKLAMLREALPGVMVSTDIIVGFPGEGEDDFMETRRLVEETRYAGLFAFKFSPRGGTAADRLDDDVPGEEKDRRLQEILSLQREISRRIYDGFVGQTMDVLVEGPGKQGEGMVTGRTRGFTVVNFPGRETLKGRILPVLIRSSGTHCLMGEYLPVEGEK